MSEAQNKNCESRLMKLESSMERQWRLTLEIQADSFLQVIARKDALIQEKEDRIKQLETEKEDFGTEVQSWQCLIEDLIQQFQKFINYSLKVDSGEAEYFLSLEKILEIRKNIHMLVITYKELISKHIW